MDSSCPFGAMKPKPSAWRFRGGISLRGSIAASDDAESVNMGPQPLALVRPLINARHRFPDTTLIHHPLNAAIGPLGRVLKLNMPEEPLPGDSRGMPRIQAPSQGASQRMAVSPGREAEGYFHLPGGQNGHPWSPYYRSGYEAWARGRATPFVPGAPVHVLELRP